MNPFNLPWFHTVLPAKHRKGESWALGQVLLCSQRHSLLASELLPLQRLNWDSSSATSLLCDLSAPEDPPVKNARQDQDITPPGCNSHKAWQNPSFQFCRMRH
ncbi:hypothetical protein Y1Q_0007067 [Alligator mississippiensis]|uniref:Uncharacterized protein n=1 Tax=Alligator mississippiensis TaxID=8496 RepID=A0A151N5D7_ALLMI|nr:hypothetical protein Y1Q_0007067 [Alligator mississippiensis]